MFRILFICHGNICRSPMAQYLCDMEIKKRNLQAKIEVSSAALSREELGNGVYPPTKKILNALGINCNSHRARQITNQDFKFKIIDFLFYIGIIKYKLGFYDVGQFVVYPFKISYNYNNEYRELHGEDITILVYPFSDGETLPPMKGTIGIPMPKYVWLFVVLIVFAIIGIIILIFAVVKYIERKFNEKINIKEDTEALNALKLIDCNTYYNENKYAEYYFELTFIFKRYLTKRFRFNIEDMTTSEINQLFKENVFNESEYIIKMFEESDYVKFAKQIPELKIMQKDYDFCVDYIVKNGNLYTALKLEEKENKNIRK